MNPTVLGGSATASLLVNSTITTSATSTTSNGTNTISNPNLTFTSADIGGTVSGAGIPASTTITAVAGSSATISNNATASSTTVTLTFGFSQAVPLTGTLFTRSQLVNSITFGFNIPPGPDLRTSAAVYDTNNVLIRQLWANVMYPPGSYTGTWDGRLDITQFANSGQQYTIKLLINNVQYNYDGQIGGTQNSWTGPSGRYSWLCSGWPPGGWQKLVFAGSKGWISCGYTEGTMQMMIFDKSNPNSPYVPNLFYTQIGGSVLPQAPDDMATDNQNVYVAYSGGVSNVNNFVSAFDARGAQAYWFSAGPATPFGQIVFSTNANWIDSYPTGVSTNALTSVAASSGGTAVYTGTIPQAQNNSLVGLPINITGFVNAANNGIWVVTANTATTLTLNNPSAVVESHAGTINWNISIPLSSVATASGGTTTYTLTTSTPGLTANALAGVPVSITGFTALGTYTVAPSNGYFTITASTPTSITVNNPYGVTQTVAGTVATSNPTLVTGIAVQRGDNVLAVAHGAMNIINLYHKGTGAFLGTITGIQYPRQMAFTSEGLWVTTLSGQLYLVTGLVSTAISPVVTREDQLLNLHYASYVAANTLTDRVYVGDGGVGPGSQQIKGFDKTTHMQSRTLGVSGGFNDCNPTASHNHILVDDYPIYGQSIPGPPVNYASNWMAVDDDDGIWVQDLRGFRVQHFDSSNNYINQILVRRPVYYTVSPQTMPTKLYLPNWMEFTQDFSKPLQPGDPDPALGGNGSWALTKFWQVCAFGGGTTPINPPLATPPTAVSVPDILYFFSVELLNGHVYGLANFHAYGNPAQLHNIFELPQDGVSPARNTGIQPPNNAPIYYPFLRDGSITQLTTSGTVPNVTVTYNKYSPVFVGNNITWGASQPQFSATSNSGNYRIVQYSSVIYTVTPEMSTGGYMPVIAQANYGTATMPVIRYPHLATMKQGTTGFAWTNLPEVCQPTAPDYLVHYPCGASTSNQIVGIQTQGRYFFAMFGGNYIPPGSQIYHFYEDGMAIGQFGNNQAYPGGGKTQSWQYLQYPVPPGITGNSISPSSVMYNGDIYYYYGDESPSLSNRWHISNLSSIQEFSGTGVLQVNGQVTLTPVVLPSVTRTKLRRRTK